MLTKISQAIFHINHYSRKIFTTAFKLHLQFCIFKMLIMILVMNQRTAISIWDRRCQTDVTMNIAANMNEIWKLFLIMFLMY